MDMKDTSNIVALKTDYISELSNTQQLCSMLMKTSHYSKMGPEGVFAVVETAKSLGVDPRQALGGGLYYVRGKVEMSARMMNALIRSRRHSVTRDKKSDDTICILHGKRSDNGDTWTESFSIQEAQKAGLTKNPVWQNFTRDMLFARALSRLARQLFPDIIGNCYVEGEISLDPNIGQGHEMEEPQEDPAQVEKEENELNERLASFAKNHSLEFEKMKGYLEMIASKNQISFKDTAKSAMASGSSFASHFTKFLEKRPS